MIYGIKVSSVSQIDRLAKGELLDAENQHQSFINLWLTDYFLTKRNDLLISLRVFQNTCTKQKIQPPQWSSTECIL